MPNNREIIIRQARKGGDLDQNIYDEIVKDHGESKGVEKLLLNAYKQSPGLAYHNKALEAILTKVLD